MEEEESIKLTLRSLHEDIQAIAEDFIAREGRKPTCVDIEGNERWKGLRETKLRIERDLVRQLPCSFPPLFPYTHSPLSPLLLPYILLFVSALSPPPPLHIGRKQKSQRSMCMVCDQKKEVK